MSVANHLFNKWQQSGYIVKTVSAIYAAPIAIWGLSSLETAVYAALRAVKHVSTKNSDDWKWAKVNGAYALSSALRAGVALVFPAFGTYLAAEQIYQDVSNHTFNTWKYEDLQKNIDAGVANAIYQKLQQTREPSVEELVQLATALTEPTQDQRDATSNLLRGTIIGASWIFTGSFHLIDGSCRLVKMAAIRIGRLVAQLIKIVAAGHFLRAIIRVGEVIRNAVVQEALYARDLVSQPYRVDFSEEKIRELTKDDVHLFLEQCPTEEIRTQNRLVFAKSNQRVRGFAVQNDLARTSNDGPVPHGAPIDYFHKVGMLPKACGCKKAVTAVYITEEKYFKGIFPYLEKFDMCWLSHMPALEKQDLIWNLSCKLPLLKEVCLDMQGIPATWQMLIGLKLAYQSPLLERVTFVNSDPRAAEIMTRFVDWRCTVIN